MNTQQLERMHKGKGFIAALDQSGGSTPKALRQYGIDESSYTTEEEMFDLVHQMRTRIITAPAFSASHILGAILFEKTMDSQIEGQYTAAYLAQKKGILPFLKVDKGLADMDNDVQLMKPIDGLDALLARAVERGVFGTKMRSVIKQANRDGIQKIVDQQFALAQQIFSAGLIPIVEPEVDIYSADKAESEKILKEELQKHLKMLGEDVRLIFKLSIPDEDNFYADLMNDPHVVRVAALSGGYSQAEAVERLARNKGMIASFSRALVEGLHVQQTDREFDNMLATSIEAIYRASVT